MSFHFPRLGLAAASAVMATALLVSGCNSGGVAGGGKPASTLEVESDLPMGSKDAKVVLVEYASVTCPHCANFHKEVLPVIKQKYVDTGKVRYIFREFPTPPFELATAGHLMARCAGVDKRNQIIDALMRGQTDWITQASGPLGAKQALLNIAASAGMSEAEFDTCMANEKLLKTLVDIRDGGIKAGVEGTPTLFINGERFEAPTGREMTADDVSKGVDAALAKVK